MDVEASPLGRRESHLTRKTRGSPDIIIYNHGKRGSGMAVDISIANPFSKVGDANPKSLTAAALSREVDKMNKYAADCNRLNLNFHPLVLDAYGGIPPSTVHHVLNPLINRVKNLCVTQLGSTISQVLLASEALCVTLLTFNAYKVKPQSGIY